MILALMPFAALALPTVLLALWPSGRRFAVAPFFGILLPLAMLLSFSMGAFMKATSLTPERYRCGLPFALPFVFVLGLGCTAMATGIVLALASSTEPVGKQILIRFMPFYVAACLLSLLAGRYAL